MYFSTFYIIFLKPDFLLVWFFFIGMYHMFLLVEDGFFHITNLALAKIKTGNKKSYQGFILLLNLHVKHNFPFTITAIERTDNVGVLKEVSYDIYLRLLL